MAFVEDSKPAKPAPRHKWTSREITKALVSRTGPFPYNASFVAVPNLSFGFLDWEADLVICSQKGYLSEIEIKVSLADWKNDFKKDKWKPAYFGSWGRIKEFWYCAPLHLAQRWEELKVPDHAGIIGIDMGTLSPRQVAKGMVPGPNFAILKSSVTNREARPLSERDMLKLARLASMRVWTQPDPVVPDKEIECQNTLLVPDASEAPCSKESPAIFDFASPTLDALFAPVPTTGSEPEGSG